MAGGWNYGIMLEYCHVGSRSPIDELYELLTLTEVEFKNWQEIIKTYKLDRYWLV